MTTINKLPIEIFNYINEYTNINNLLLSCKSFEQFKKKLYYWKLTKEYSKKFYYNIDFHNINFRKKILSKMFDSKKQLSLNLSACNGITDVSTLSDVHALNLSWCYNIIDISALSGVHTLNLSFCNRITDVSALSGVHTLNLSHCHRIRDISALNGVHTLNLSALNRICFTNSIMSDCGRRIYFAKQNIYTPHQDV